MGGHALRTVVTGRLPAAAYHRLAADVAQRLTGAWPLARPFVIPAYESKPDFGDLDLLVDAAGVPENAAQDLRALFDSREVVTNGPVISLEVDAFQVDVIRVPTEAYVCAAAYFAYNDAGNLMGRVARAMGFKFGFEGLFYLVRDGDRLVAQICVSRDPRAILDFLGYDFEAFVYGFERLEDIFAFVASSPFFDPASYALEARNHTARTRDRKRASYRAFLEWIDQHAQEPGAQARRDKTVYLERAGRMFPSLRQHLADVLEQDLRRRARSQRFNGDLVAQATGLRGRALGVLMQTIPDRFGGRHAFDVWLDAAPSPEAVLEEIQGAHRQLAMPGH